MQCLNKAQRQRLVTYANALLNECYQNVRHLDDLRARKKITFRVYNYARNGKLKQIKLWSAVSELVSNSFHFLRKNGYTVLEESRDVIKLVRLSKYPFTGWVQEIDAFTLHWSKNGKYVKSFKLDTYKIPISVEPKKVTDRPDARKIDVVASAIVLAPEVDEENEQYLLLIIILCSPIILIWLIRKVLLGTR